MANFSPGVNPASADNSTDNLAAHDRAQVQILVGLYNRCISQALCTVLRQEEPDFEICESGEAGPTFSPTLLLTDLPTLEQENSNRWPTAKIIIFDEGLDQQQIEKAFSYPNVSGLIRNDCDNHLLMKAIHCVQKDEMWIDNETLKTLLQQHRTHPQESNQVHLTNKEKQIVSYILQGLKNKEIADQVFLSESTIKVYISRIYKKYQVSTRAQLVSKLTQTSHLH